MVLKVTIYHFYLADAISIQFYENKHILKSLNIVVVVTVSLDYMLLLDQ